VTGVAAFGLFVELIEHFVEGLVHVSSMADDYYRYLQREHALRGENTKKAYRLGEKVSVQVVRVDTERRQIDLALVDVLDAVRRSSSGRRAARSRMRAKREHRKAEGRRGARRR
jgi:ribonuclease R